MSDTETTDRHTAAVEQRSEHGNGGVEIIDSDGFGKTVRSICVGCGEEIDEFDIFPDRVEEQLESRPIHDTAKCAEKARAATEAEQ